MRVLGIETSSRRGSVALVDGGRVLARATHAELNAHAEQLRPLLERVLGDAGVEKSTLERVAVGIGPGSFTGVRVGVAFAQGIALGLGIPLVGVQSLRAMAEAAPAARDEPRVPLLDARRGEVFAAAYAADGGELLAPRTIARELALAELGRVVPGRPLYLGEVASELGADPLRSEATDLPDATWVAMLGSALPVSGSAVEPLYVRDAGATLPRLPPSPLGED
jgi:tRNA threonylcarbamoyladenosine biosynthesis protein TsaB